MAKKKEDTGAEASKPSSPFKISKLIIHPSRKINLGNYESVDCSAGFEITFDKPQELDSNIIDDAVARVHEKLQTIFRQQKDSFGKKPKAEQK